MLTYTVRGGRPLVGRVAVSGAKNAAIPLLLATVAAGDRCLIHNVPEVSDIAAAADLLRHLGAEITPGYAIEPAITRTDIPAALAGRLRMSVILLAPLVARFGEASTASPGGCEIGARPVDFHLAGLRALGADVREAGGRITCRANHLRGAEIALPMPSVGATHHMILAGALADGETVIFNAAREPEVVQLAEFLNRMGARVAGAGTSTVHIHGVSRLVGAELTLIPDRIEAGTYLLAAAAAGGDVTVEGARPDHLEALLGVLRRGGCGLTATADSVRLRAAGRPRPVDITTDPFPGFPTDLQSPALAWLLRCQGSCRIVDTVFPDRFGGVPELRKMGAQVDTDHGYATVTGVARLQGAALQAAPDLRGAAALLVAALAADGETTIAGADALARGYHALDQRLRALGADINARA